ncbi:MAG: type IV toxin-antitoxin system AbiEi family antitoxin domain-containing protein [Acidimicrobiia bacterium]
MSPDENPDHETDRLAAHQCGAISRRQAIAAGLTSKQVRARVESGRWRRVLPGVYVIAGAPSSWEQDAMVPLLAGPAGTVLSHLTAAAMVGLCDPPPIPHVTVPRLASGRFGNAIVHRPKAPLEPLDRQDVGPFPCTTPARTLVDCAALLGDDDYCGLLDTALCRGLASAAEVRAAATRAARAPGRDGLPRLEQALQVWAPGPAPGSPAEMRLARLIVGWGLPCPERQVEIRDERGGFVARCDLGWREQKVVLEYDGAEWHGPRRAPLDATRQRRIEALGWRVIRVRKTDVKPPARALRAELLAVFADPRAA